MPKPNQTITIAVADQETVTQIQWFVMILERTDKQHHPGDSGIRSGKHNANLCRGPAGDVTYAAISIQSLLIYANISQQKHRRVLN